MKALSAFYDLLLPELPGCTPAFVDHHLLEVAREYCEAAGCWRAAVTIQTAAGTYTYDVSEPEAEAALVRPVRLVLDGTLQWDEAWAADEPNVGGRTQPLHRRDRPPFVMSDDMRELTLLEDLLTPTDNAEGLVLTVTLRPADDADELPDLLFTEHRRHLRAGVLSRLMAMGGKPWTNLSLAGVYLDTWESATQYAASNATRGNTRARLATRKAPF